MKTIMKTREIIRQPGVLIWEGSPSDHSGAYHVILSIGIDGRPIEIGIENPDSCRLEIPGLLDSGWDAEPEGVVEEFFASAKTFQPLEGVYFNLERVDSVEDLQKHIRGYCPGLEAFFNDPQTIPEKPKRCDGSILIYSRIGNRVETDSFKEFFRPDKEDAMTKLGDRLFRVGQFVESGSEGFIQIIMCEDWLSVDKLADIFCLWLWGSADRLVRRFNE